MAADSSCDRAEYRLFGPIQEAGFSFSDVVTHAAGQRVSTGDSDVNTHLRDCPIVAALTSSDARARPSLLHLQHVARARAALTTIIQARRREKCVG